MTTPAADFVRGDTDASGKLSVTDAIRILQFLFAGAGEAVTCQDAADADDSGALAVTDPLFVLNTLFQSGIVPPAPFPGCGSDPTDDAIDCAQGRDCAPVSFEYTGFPFTAGAAFFVIDRSGTQQGNGELAKSKAETARAIRAFPDGFEFGVFFADRGLITWPTSGMPAVADDDMRESGAAFVESVAGGSGSCDIPALLAALNMAKAAASAEKLVFYLGDGGGTCSGAAEDSYLEKMRSEVTAANAGTARLHTMATGPLGDLQKSHMEELARLNGGQFFEVFQ